jgi:serine/threonine-protein kinase HipA
LSTRPGVRLGVFLGGERIGEIERRGPSRYRFSYLPGATSERASDPVLLSASLPVRERPFPPAESAPFFEGLLPEGSVRAAIAKALHLSEEDGFGLLGALGADCAGAVAVLQPEAMPAPAGGGRLRRLDGGELARLVEDLPRHPLGVDSRADGVRLSLGGVQHKLVLAGSPWQGFSQPLEGAPSTCLLKPELGPYEGLVANEAFCMKATDSATIRTSSTWNFDVGSIPCLYVERFDRAHDADGNVVRVHQEDMCQALGILPSGKYEDNGGPSVRHIVELIRSLRGRFMARDINDFVHAVLVNFLLGNSDAHGKNFALLYEPGSGVRLAPAYDVVSTAVYPDLTTRMAMSIGGIDDPAGVGMDAWVALAEECAFGGGMVTLVRRRTAALLRSVELWRDVSRREGWHSPVIDAIIDVCHQRAAQLTG